MDLNYLMDFNPLQLLSFVGTQACPSLVRGKIRVAPEVFSRSLTLWSNGVVQPHLVLFLPQLFLQEVLVLCVCLFWFVVENGISRPHPRYQVWWVLLGWPLLPGLFSGFLKGKYIMSSHWYFWFKARTTQTFNLFYITKESLFFHNRILVLRNTGDVRIAHNYWRSYSIFWHSSLRRAILKLPPLTQVLKIMFAWIMSSLFYLF